MSVSRLVGQLLATVIAVITSVVVPGAAHAGGHDCDSWSGCVGTEGRDKGIRTVVTKVRDDVVPARGAPGQYGEAPERTAWRTYEEGMIPACYGNTFPGGDALCNTALSCPGDDQIRWWIWHKYTDHVRNPDGTVTSTPDPGGWEQLPGSYCLGPDDQGVPTIGQVIARVQTGFQDLPLPSSGIQVDPAPNTLVNIPTAFFAGGNTTAEFNPTILGTTVNIDAEATSWTWNWGDGSPPQTFSTPGEPKRPVVSHVYTRPGDYAATVTVTWTGSFSIAGSTETFAIRQPVTITSEPVAVQVREARTQLVDQ